MNDCGTIMRSPRPNRLYCSDACRLEAFEKRRQDDEIRAAQVAGVELVERQLAQGDPTIIVNGREIQRESAWAATQGLRATWDIDGAKQTGKVMYEEGQWWALVMVPLGAFPG